MKIELTYESKIEIEFCDPEKATTYFIDGEWSKTFYAFDDLKELARHLGTFLIDEDWWNWNYEHKSWGCVLDGYPEFLKTRSDNITIGNDYGEDHGDIKAQVVDHLESTDYRIIILEGEK